MNSFSLLNNHESISSVGWLQSLGFLQCKCNHYTYSVSRSILSITIPFRSSPVIVNNFIEIKLSFFSHLLLLKAYLSIFDHRQQFPPYLQHRFRDTWCFSSGHLWVTWILDWSNHCGTFVCICVLYLYYILFYLSQSNSSSLYRSMDQMSSSTFNKLTFIINYQTHNYIEHLKVCFSFSECWISYSSNSLNICYNIWHCTSTKAKPYTFSVPQSSQK